ncbi:diacylglycerol kinase [Ochrobactrum pseudogrignonense]|nr:diacylglycerol kinase [Brucella pseudogrignonensis]
MAATTYSLGGARRLFKEEAARHELVAFILVSILFFLASVSIKSILLFVLLLILIALEALNTAIEEIVDVVSPTYSTAARHAKDLGSFAVFA